MGKIDNGQFAFDLSPLAGTGGKGGVDPRRVPLGVGELYVGVEDATIDGRSRWADPAYAWSSGTKFRLLHVMSPAAGGEVRGYFLREGVAWLRSPSYAGRWPDVDEAVARVFACTIAPYSVTSGGVVQFMRMS